MNSLTADQIQEAIDRQKEKAMRERLAENAMLAACWWNVMDESIRDARADSVRMQNGQTAAARRVRANSEQTAAAWERAQYLFFALLPGMLDELREAVAAQIEREYKGIAAADVSDNLRNMKRGDLLKYQE